MITTTKQVSNETWRLYLPQNDEEHKALNRFATFNHSIKDNIHYTFVDFFNNTEYLNKFKSQFEVIEL